MSIEITVGNKESIEGGIKFNTNIRKSLDGNLMIYSSEDLDILVDIKNNKVVAMSTDQKVNDKIYDSQNRFFKFLVKRGIIDPKSVRFGHIFGALEGKILQPDNPKINAIDLCLLNILKWVEKEKPGFLYTQQMKQNRIEDLTEPESGSYTPLGKVKQSSFKGSSERNIGAAATNAFKPY